MYYVSLRVSKATRTTLALVYAITDGIKAAQTHKDKDTGSYEWYTGHVTSDQEAAAMRRKTARLESEDIHSFGYSVSHAASNAHVANEPRRPDQ